MFQMDFFWNLTSRNGKSIAFSDENGDSFSYSDFQDNVDKFATQLPAKKSLVLLKSSNNIKTITAYIACLQKRHPVILVDSELDDVLLNKIVSVYNPNLLVNSEYVEHRHSLELELHPELALMLSTSGTTGSPKLVRLSFSNLQSNAESITQYLNICESDVAITTMPLHYSFGLSLLNSHLHTKAKVVVTDKSIMSRELWQLIQQHQVSSLSGVPYFFQMLKKMKYERFNTQSVRYLTQAGGKLDSETLTYFIERCKSKEQSFVVMYGQTEATARIAYVPPDKLESKQGSIGVPIPQGKLCIKTEAGLLTSEPHIEGELVYEGPNVMLGYASELADLKAGDQNKGVLETGDLGFKDPEGFYFITGRSKRFIKIFGLRISLDAVDEILASKSIVAASTGSDDKLCIFIEESPELSMQDVRYLISSTLKVNINSIQIIKIDTIPRTPNGKIDSKELKRLMESYEQS